MLQTSSLQRAVYFLLLAFLSIAGCYWAKSFLIPICFSALLAMLFFPLSRWFESKGIPRGLSVLLCILIFLTIVASLIWVISWQISDLTSEVSDIENKTRKIFADIKQYISSHFGITPNQQEELIIKQSETSSGILSNIGSSIIIFMINFILVLVYTFLLMYFRTRIKKFILQLVSGQQTQNTEEIIHEIQKVSLQYLTGIGLMILCLWVMYSIGFSIVGVKYAILFAILCGLLELVPFVGNLTGNLLAIFMVIIQGGSFGMVIGVLITYAIIQFLQTYILEPLVVGAEVNINPLFTIIILVAGELVWGIPGMVLAIPLLGIAKIICDHIEPLKPYGFLIGSSRKRKSALIRKK